jgi:hypothetical protein
MPQHGGGGGGGGGGGFGGDTSAAFGSPTAAGGGDSSSILDEVKELVETMSKHSSSIDDEVGEVGEAGRAVNLSATATAAAAAAGDMDLEHLNERVAAAFLQAVERQMNEAGGLLRTCTRSTLNLLPLLLLRVSV